MRFMLTVLLSYSLSSPLLAQRRVENEIIIKLKSSVSENTVNTFAARDWSRVPSLAVLNNRFKIQKVSRLFESSRKSHLRKGNQLSIQKFKSSGLDRIFKLEVPPGVNLDAALAAYAADSNIAYAQPNNLYTLDFVPNDSAYTSQWALHKIEMEKAWDIEKGSPNILVGLIDTGIDFLHPDLKDNIWVNPGEDIQHRGIFDSTVFNGKDDDGNGYVDDLIGWDFVNHTNNPMDRHGHGTEVAGVIAAKSNNGIGVAGIAFGCKLVALRAFDETGLGEDVNIASAIVYAADNGIRVINMSFGDVVISPIMRDVIRYAYDKNVVLVASSGNAGGDDQHYPSNYYGVISVGATTRDDFLTYFTTYGELMDLVAPGESIATTSLGGGYREYSGTSFSAPCVSGVAALILSHNPTFSNAEVRGILVTSTDDVSGEGWTHRYGAGRLNAYKALQVVYAPKVEIESPLTDVGINQNSLTVIGSAASPFLQSYSLYYGVGQNPAQWFEITPPTPRQVISDTIAVWNTQTLSDTSYILRLVVTERNGKAIEDKIRVFMDKAAPAVTDFQQMNVLDEDKYGVLITFRTKSLSEAKIYFRLKGTTESFQELRLNGVLRNHFILLTSENTLPDVEYEYYLEITNTAGVMRHFDNSGRNFTFTRSNNVAPRQNNFIPKQYTLPSSYLLNKIADFNRNGSKEVLLNQYAGGFSPAGRDFASLNFGKMKLFEFRDGNFVQVDSVNRIQIPKDFGDSNGDGKLEVFSQADGKSFLFEQAVPNGSPFATVVFADTVKGNFWASQMNDIDSDGKLELIARNDEAYMVWKNTGGNNYSQVAFMPNPTEPGPGESDNQFGPPHSEIADFDGDGKKEILVGDADADFYIYEYNGGNSYVHTWSDENDGVSGSDFIAHGDYDGDGKPEFIVGYHTSLGLNSDNEYDAPYWTFKMFKATGDNKFAKIWEQKFFGVMDEFYYDSGISSGDIDGDGKDEFFISVYPNYYVFSYNKAAQTFEPIWYYHNARTNATIVGDFDGNGVNEFGFNDGEKVRFFEKDVAFTGPSTPVNFEAVALDSNLVQLSWNPVPNATSYVVMSNEWQTSALPRIDTTTDTFYLDRKVRNNAYFQYAIASIDTTKRPSQSRWTEQIVVFVHPKSYLVSADYLKNGELKVKFSQYVGDTPPNPSSFVVIDNTGSDQRRDKACLVPNTVAIASDREMLLVFRDGLSNGSYFLKVRNLRDRFGTPVDTSRKVSFSVTAPLEKAFYLMSFRLVGSRSIDLEFSDAVDVATGSDPSHYRIEPGIEVVSAIVDVGTKNLVHLTISGRVPIGALGKEYVISVTGVKSVSGVMIASGAGSTGGMILNKMDLSEVFAYPNPFREGGGTNHITFANLTQEATITIWTLSGNHVRTLQETDGNGGIEWFLDDDHGNKVSSGIYVYRVTGTNSRGEQVAEKIGKVAVVR